MNDDLNLGPRIEEVRDKNIERVKILELEEIENVFNENVKSINKNMIHACELNNIGKNELNKSVLRSQIVFIESTFDYVCHVLVKYGLKQIYDGNWGRTNKYNEYLIPMRILADCSYSDISFDKIIEYVNFKISPDTFLGYNKFRDAFNLIHEGLLDDLGQELYPGENKSVCNTKLKQIIETVYNRRNQIVHQADREHKSGEEIEITKEQAEDYIANIKKIVNGLIKVVKKY